MEKQKIIRITTVLISLEKLLEGQLSYMQDYYEVTAISSDKEGLEKYSINNGVPTYHIEFTRQITPLKDLAALFKLYKYLKRVNPQIVHTHTPKAGIVGMLAAYLARVPHRLHTVAGLPLMETTGFKRTILNAVERLTYLCATKVYPNSKGLSDFILKEKLVRPEKLMIIGNGSSNGIDTQFFNPSLYGENEKAQLRKSLNIPAEDFVFIFVGRLVGDKGINELVQSFISFQMESKRSSLVLVGPLETTLDPLNRKTLDAIETNPKIVAVGFQNDVRPYFAMSNVLTFPSYREGFPNVVLQASAMGLPCIVSNINGCNEIIEHSINGLIIPVKRVEPLRDALIQMYNNTALYLSMKKNARSRIVQKYDRLEIWEAILAEYRSL